jgi:hypothetical protein
MNLLWKPQHCPSLTIMAIAVAIPVSASRCSEYVEKNIFVFFKIIKLKSLEVYQARPILKIETLKS